MTPRILSTFPSTDRAFQRAVERLAADPGSATKDDLVERLRPLFPRVAAFERQLTGEPSHLYVFRDGRYEAARTNGWWKEPGVACVVISLQTGRLTRVSAEYADLMRADPQDLVGRHYTEFLQPEARLAAEAMFGALAESHEIATEALVRRTDGSTLWIELHATRRDGEVDVRYRPIPEEPRPGERSD